MLELQAIAKRYGWRGRLAVDRLSFQVGPGEVVGLVGLNGAGKTTSLRIACGVTLPTAGDVLVDGFSVRRQKAEASRLLGWVPEQPVHDSNVRVRSLVRYYASVAGRVGSPIPDRLLDDWGLTDYGRKRFRELSLGYKRRLAVVVASLTDPMYYLLDEPFNGLDPVAMVQFRKWIVSAKTAGHGVLLSSHVLREVQSLCDRVVVIHHGRILATETASAIEASSRTRREVTVVLDRVDPRATELLAKFGRVVASGTTIKIQGENLEPGRINAELVRAGYSVHALTTGASDLEDYFLRLVGEAS